MTGYVHTPGRVAVGLKSIADESRHPANSQLPSSMVAANLKLAAVGSVQPKYKNAHAPLSYDADGSKRVLLLSIHPGMIHEPSSTPAAERKLRAPLKVQPGSGGGG